MNKATLLGARILLWCVSAAAVIFFAFTLAAFTPTMKIHYLDMNAEMPRKNTVWVCHGSGCEWKVKYRFKKSDIATFRTIFANVKTPADEIKAIRYAIARAETIVAPIAGTANDRPGGSIMFSKIKGELDCVDESINTTSYMLVFQHNKLLRYHHAVIPHVDAGFAWPHWAGQFCSDKGVCYVLDSYWGANGTLPKLRKKG